MCHARPGTGDSAVNFKTILIAVTAAAALIGAAIVAVPTTTDKASEAMYKIRAPG